MLGRMWRPRMRRSLAPSARAASTYSFSRAASTCARTRRAYPTHPPSDSANTRLKIPGPRKATKAIAIRIPGNDKNVRRRLGIDIFESEDMFILVNFLGRNLATNYFAK